jgi:peptide-methionine (R)-S-oxide reductase
MTDTQKKIKKTDAEWRAELTPEQYEVTRKAGTERAFTGPYVNEKTEGMYT